MKKTFNLAESAKTLAVATLAGLTISGISGCEKSINTKNVIQLSDGSYLEKGSVITYVGTKTHTGKNFDTHKDGKRFWIRETSDKFTIPDHYKFSIVDGGAISIPNLAPGDNPNMSATTKPAYIKQNKEGQEALVFANKTEIPLNLVNLRTNYPYFFAIAKDGSFGVDLITGFRSNSPDGKKPSILNNKIVFVPKISTTKPR
jgi:hypothetical protein